MLTLWKESYDQLRQHIKNRDITLPTNVHTVKALVFPIVMYRYGSWMVMKAEQWRIGCFWTVVLKKTLKRPLDCKEIKSVIPKGNQSWIFIEGTDPEVEAEILWPTEAKSQLIRKYPDDGKDWGQEEKGTTEYEMVGYHQINRNEFKQTPRDREGHGSLASCSHGAAKSWTRLRDWTNTIGLKFLAFLPMAFGRK